MTDRELEHKIRTAFSHAAPDILDTVLQDCQRHTERKVIVMNNSPKRRTVIKRLVGIAAGLFLLLAVAAHLPKNNGSLPATVPTTTGATTTGAPATSSTEKTTSTDVQVTTQTAQIIVTKATTVAQTTTVAQPTGDTPTTTGTIPTQIADPYANMWSISHPFKEKMWINCAFSARDVVDPETYDAFIKQFQHLGGTRPLWENNAYVMIQELNIPREVFERACQTKREQYGSSPNACVLTEADVEMLYTGTKAEVYAYFLTAYAVLVDETPYSVYWLATHTAEEYVAAGMTTQQVEAAYLGIFSENAELNAGQREHVREQLSRMLGETYTSFNQ